MTVDDIVTLAREALDPKCNQHEVEDAGYSIQLARAVLDLLDVATMAAPPYAVTVGTLKPRRVVMVPLGGEHLEIDPAYARAVFVAGLRACDAADSERP